MSIYASSSILTCLIGLPLIGSLPLALLPGSRVKLIRTASLMLLTGMLVTGIAAAYLFNWSAAAPPISAMQLQQQFLFLPTIGMYYHVGVDNLSMPLVLVVLALALIAGLAGLEIQQEAKRFYILLMLLAAAAVGALVSLDLMFFAAFVQLGVIPGYFLIALWGKERSPTVAMKFALFQTLGSTLIFVAVLTVLTATRRAGFPHGCLDMLQLLHNSQFLAFFKPGQPGAASGELIFFLIFAGLATRLPTIPLHLWIPDTLAEGPASAVMLLIPANAIIGGYGILRILLGLFPYEFLVNHVLLAILGVAGIIYGGLCALAQTDLKRLLGYWVISQAGYVLLGMALLSQLSIEGALVQMIGLSVALGLTLWIAQIIEHRAHHCDLNRLGGLARQMPGFFGVSALGMAAALGTPGLCLFAGPMMVIFGAINSHGILSASPTAALWSLPAMFGIIAAAGMVLTAGYILWTFERVYLSSPKPEFHHFSPLLLSERLVVWPLTAGAIILGMLPGIVLIKPLSPAVATLLEQLWRALGH